MFSILLACSPEPTAEKTAHTEAASTHSAEPLHSTEAGHSGEPPAGRLHSTEPHTSTPPGEHTAADSGGPTCWDEVVSSGYARIATDFLGDDVDTTCGALGTEDWVGRYVAPAAGEYVVALADIASFVPIAATLQVLESCGGAEVGCAVDTFSGQPTIIVDLDQYESVLLVVEAPHPYSPSYYAEVSVRVAPLETTEVGCLDGFDDDADGGIDCADLDCVGEPSCDCVSGEVLEAGTPLADTTVGAGSALRTACSYYTGNDRSYRFVAPSAGRWAFEAASPSRAVVSVTDRCGGAEYTCDNSGGGYTGGRVELDLAAAEEVVVTVETMYGDDSFTVEVTGP